MRASWASRGLAIVVAAALAIGLVVAYLVDSDARATATSPVSAKAGAGDAGSIVATTPLTRVSPEILAVSEQAVRLEYRSSDAISGRATVVSGSAFLPKGLAPQGGWPVIGLGHEGSGVDQDCAPSLSSTLLGESARVAALLKRGYAVAVTDYQGLGMPGEEPDFLDVATAGRNVIDSVRALRGAFPNVSARWAAFGATQGGGAVWAADQQAQSYAPELSLVGAVALSPLTDASSLVDVAARGELTPSQRVTLLWSLTTLGRRQPTLNLDDYRHGVVAQHWDALTACSGPLVHEGKVAAKLVDRFDLAPSSPRAADALRALMGSRAVPTGSLGAPLFVSYQTSDDVVDPDATTDAIHRNCAAGATINWRTENGAQRAAGGESKGISWLADRFADLSVVNGCQAIAAGSPGAGAVVSTEAIPEILPALPPGARAARVLYGSTNGDTGAHTVVTGTVFAPPGTAPFGGWPVVAYGHATTGIDQGCAPSLSLAVEAPVVAALLQLGVAVAYTDYEGLGPTGVHSYLDARTAGYNVIDSVRALRATFTDISSQWAGIGHSQGAAAVWAADEQAADYAPELDLVGAVALAPPADMTGIVDKAADGTLSTDQLAAFQMIVSSTTRLHPELDIDQFRRGSALANWAVLKSCNPAQASERLAAVAQLRGDELKPANPQVADQLRAQLRRWALPQRALSAPLSVVYGTADPLIDTPWTTDAVTAACHLGDVLHIDEQTNKGHADLDWVAQLDWLRQRFEGLPMKDDCPAS